eukprot:765454-Hanusia_phi.AAC.2
MERTVLRSVVGLLTRVDVETSKIYANKMFGVMVRSCNAGIARFLYMLRRRMGEGTCEVAIGEFAEFDQSSQRVWPMLSTAGSEEMAAMALSCAC